MNTLQQMADAMLLLADARRSNNWPAMRLAAQEIDRLAKIMQLDEAARPDGSVARWNWCEAKPLPKLNPTNWRNHNSN